MFDDEFMNDMLLNPDLYAVFDDKRRKEKHKKKIMEQYG